MLRKEKGISQKKVAEDLGISQALLSHYEKGVRECGLGFIVKVADYYNVSTDYLLGRAPEPDGAVIHVDEIATDDANIKDNAIKGSILPVLNKKLIINSLNIIFDLLKKTNNRYLTSEVSDYLMISVYKMFRIIFSSNDKNPDTFFSLSENMYSGLSSASQMIAEASSATLAKGVDVENKEGLTKAQKDALLLSSQQLKEDYPVFSSSLHNLIKNTEKNISSKDKK